MWGSSHFSPSLPYLLPLWAAIVFSVTSHRPWPPLTVPSHLSLSLVNLSSSPNLSLSFTRPFFLSLSLVSLSKTMRFWLPSIHSDSGKWDDMRWPSWSRRRRSSWAQLLSPWNVVVGGGEGAWKTTAEMMSKLRSLATFDSGSRSH